MLITTTDHIPNQEIAAITATLFSEQVLSINVVKDLVHGIKGIFGAKMDAYAKEYRHAREQALADLEAQAEKHNADAIIKLSLRHDQFVNDGLIFVVVTASAVAVSLQKPLR